jgi:hypothetical protein
MDKGEWPIEVPRKGGKLMPHSGDESSVRHLFKIQIAAHGYFRIKLTLI